MQPITQDNLAANAYRTLGLGASAGQAAIDSAARRMRIWPDPAHIPPTPWDLIPWLGPVRRARNDIEQAVARLSHPQTRVRERLLWYQSQRAPAASSLQDQPPIFTTGDATTPAEAHDAALAALHLAYGSDSALADPAKWKAVMQGLTTLAHWPTYESWLAQIERDGDFEKRASAEEISAALVSLTPALASALVSPATTSLQNGTTDPRALVDLLRLASSEKSGAVDHLLDRLEDSLSANCRKMDADLRDRLRTNHQSPSEWFKQNREPSYQWTNFYNDTIAPALELFCELAGENS